MPIQVGSRMIWILLAAAVVSALAALGRPGPRSPGGGPVSLLLGAAPRGLVGASGPFDCDSEYSNWRLAWSDGQKEWCCSERQMGCEGAAAAAEEEEDAEAQSAEAQKSAEEKNAEEEARAQAAEAPGAEAQGAEAQGAEAQAAEAQAAEAQGAEAQSAEAQGAEAQAAEAAGPGGAPGGPREEEGAEAQGAAEGVARTTRAAGTEAGAPPTTRAPEAATTTAAAEPAGASLFCFTVVTDDGVVPGGGAVAAGYERALVNDQQAKGLGVFACDESKLYEGSRAALGEWDSVVNTEVFVKIWRQVEEDGLYKGQAWTVKADADAVFFPDRLQWKLEHMSAATDVPQYLKNIDFKWNFMGALEVLNRKAVDVFLDNLDSCQAKVGGDGGEDYFLMTCLEDNGVGSAEDTSLLNDKYKQESGWHLFDVSPCVDGGAAAFHPYKAVESWMGCHKVALGEMQLSDLPECDFDSSGIVCSLA